METKDNSVLSKQNIIWVVSSNILTLLTAVVIGIIMPKFVSYSTYAGYRTYTLYISYVGIFHLGLVNGVALRFGDTNYKDLPFERFRLYTGQLMVMELAFQLVLLGIYCIYLRIAGLPMSITPVVFVIINIFQANLRHYFSTIDRFSGRFRADAALNVVYDALLLVGLGAILLRGIDSSFHYLVYITMLNAGLLLMYLVLNREITIGEVQRGGDRLQDMAENIRRGNYVMWGELIGALILGIDSIFAHLFYDDRSFSEYTFAVYIIVAAYTLMSAIDSLIFPYLKRQEDSSDNLGSKYLLFKKAALIMAVVMTLAIILGRPLITWILPAYTGSIEILSILSCTLVFRALLGLACGNFMRALDMEKEYFKINIIALALAVISDAAVYLITGQLKYIAAASVAVYAVWFVIADLAIRKNIRARGR